MWGTLRDLFNSAFGNNYPPQHQLVSLHITAKRAAVTKADLGAKQTAVTKADLGAKQKKVTTVALMEADWGGGGVSHYPAPAPAESCVLDGDAPPRASGILKAPLGASGYAFSPVVDDVGDVVEYALRPLTGSVCIS